MERYGGVRRDVAEPVLHEGPDVQGVVRRLARAARRRRAVQREDRHSVQGKEAPRVVKRHDGALSVLTSTLPSPASGVPSAAAGGGRKAEALPRHRRT